MNVIARLEYELAYYDSAVHRFNHYTTVYEGICAKNLQATILFVDFTKAFGSIHEGKREHILLTYDLSKETVAAIMVFYRNTKVKVHSPDGDKDYFDIVAGVL